MSIFAFVSIRVRTEKKSIYKSSFISETYMSLLYFELLLLFFLHHCIVCEVNQCLLKYLVQQQNREFEQPFVKRNESNFFYLFYRNAKKILFNKLLYLLSKIFRAASKIKTNKGYYSKSKFAFIISSRANAEYWNQFYLKELGGYIRFRRMS